MSRHQPAGNPTRLAFEAGGRRAGETCFTCTLCGCRFSHAGLACGSCPLRAGCDVVVCPHCGFQFPRTSRAAEWARRLLGRRPDFARSLRPGTEPPTGNT